MKIIPLKPRIRFLLKTVNLIGQFSLFSPIIALTRASHKTNSDRSRANFLIYMGTSFTSYPKLCAMLHLYFLSSAFTQLLSICTALWGENLRIFINILVTAQYSEGACSSTFQNFYLKKDAIAILSWRTDYCLLKATHTTLLYAC